MTGPLLVWRRSRRLYAIARARDIFMVYYIETKKLRECSLCCVEADVPLRRTYRTTCIGFLLPINLLPNLIFYASRVLFMVGVVPSER